MNQKGDIALKNVLQLIFVVLMLAALATCGIKIKTALVGDDTLADKSFVDLVNEIRLLKESRKFNEPQGVQLVLEEEMVVVYFEPLRSKMNVVVDMGIRDASIDILRPSSCHEEKSCLCLFTENEIKDNSEFYGSYVYEVEAKKARCEDNLGINLRVGTCEFGKNLGVDSYTCTGGFMIERLLIKEITSDFSGDPYFEAPRRMAFHLTQDSEGILIAYEK